MRNLKKIMSLTRRAIDDYEMIEENDKIAVGLSGGKDSLTLAIALNNYKRFAPIKFDVVAIIIDIFNGTTDYSKQIAFCEQQGIKVVKVNSNINEVVFDIRKEKNPCSLCAKLRRGTLNTEALKLGCNKVALGHHSDDLTQTFFLSLFYEGRLSTFHPKSYLSTTKLTVIRPLIYLTEREIINFTRDLPIIHNCCPANKNTQRENIKNIIEDLNEKIPIVKERVFSAITRTERNNLIPPTPAHILEYNQKHKIDNQDN